MRTPSRVAILTALACVLAIPVGARILTADDPPRPQVQMIVDYGDGVQKHFTALAWRDGMTVLDALELAQQHARGIRFAYRGQDATAFLTRIDDLENEGRGSNWVYRVNGEMADRSFAIFPLKAGDAILWKFGDYR
jgi:hypothetical protein